MFSYINKDKTKVRELINVTNKTIIDEMDFINKMCFVYSMLKVEHPNVFKENLEILLKKLVELKNLRWKLEETIGDLKDICEIEKLESIYSLSELQIFAEQLIEEDLDSTINNIVEHADVNGISMDEKFNILAKYLDDQEYQYFLNVMYTINQEVNEYISRSIGATNKKVEVR